MTGDGGMLVVSALYAGYDRSAPVVRGASLMAARGEIVALLGPNGAGKSTLLRAIAGLVPRYSGSVRLADQDIGALPPHRMLAHGMAFVPQSDNVFSTLSVHENLRLGADRLSHDLRRPRLDEAYALYPDLARQRRLLAGRLSGGQRQMLAIVRAMMGRPKVLLLDEPSAGLSPKMVTECFARLAQLRGTGTAIVLVEQNTRAALSVADRAYVLVAGSNRYEGTARALAENADMASLYLGIGGACALGPRRPA